MGRRGPKPKSPRTDYQQNEVYAWEDQFLGAKNATSPEGYFRGVLRAICKAYRVPRPVIRAMPKGKFYQDAAALCWADNGALYFRRGYRSVLTLCHELSHWVLDHYGYPDIGHHGPRFVGVYLYMLQGAQVMPLNVGIASAKHFGLDFRDPYEECSPERLKRYLQED